MRFSRLTLILFVLSGIFFAITSFANDQKSFIDVHTHLVPGKMPFKRTPAYGQRPIMPRKPPGEKIAAMSTAEAIEGYKQAADRLIREMDKLGVEYAIVMPPPHTKGQKNAYTYRELLPAIQRHPNRLFFGGGGAMLNKLIHATDPDEVTEDIQTEFDRLARQIIADGAKCFGELAVLHLSYNKTHVFEQRAADHPLFLQLADLSAQYDIPIEIHMDCVPEYMPTPESWLRRSPNNPKYLNANVPSLETLLKHNRNSKIVWQHVGRDTLNTLTPELIRDLLSRHPNLYCAIWVGSEEMLTRPNPAGTNQIVDENYKIKKEWLALFEDYPDRFMIGTDGFFAKTAEEIDPSVESTWKFLEMLPETLRNKIGGENAARIYNIN